MDETTARSRTLDGARPAFRPWLVAERLTDAVESWAAPDRVVRPLTNWFAKLVGPGRLKDVLSGTWQGHPAHPMLTDVPIGAWTSAFVLDLLGGEKRSAAADSLIGIGILAALPTAVTGLSDLADVEDRPRRNIGAAHALGNVTGLTLYSAAYVLRKSGRRKAGVALSMAAAVAMSGAGYLGGHLSFRKGVGVDVTVFDTGPKQWTAVMDGADLPEGAPRKVTVGRTDVLLYRSGDRIFALANRCTHRGGPLNKGRIENGEVRCPWHLSTFRLDDGSVIQGPATAPQPRFEARTTDGKVEVRLVAPARASGA